VSAQQFQTATEQCSCGASLTVTAWQVDSLLTEWRRDHVHIERDTHLALQVAELTERMDHHVVGHARIEQRLTTVEQSVGYLAGAS
jgi:hypothetical protein